MVKGVSPKFSMHTQSTERGKLSAKNDDLSADCRDALAKKASVQQGETTDLRTAVTHRQKGALSQKSVIY